MADGPARAVSVRLPVPLWEAIEKARGDVPRERWIRRALERALPPAPGPAHARSSRAVKAGVAPIEKAGK